ncbi:MAG: SH3 domain-containing protein [Anaerolineae bacterium]|jgi:uncharacterized protein YgiM (DUF1202 family)|nr:SH3 domain-containing protein [Anaerolineae bacterium]MBT6322756.1 SH3 domain-containing protein [Anaerolineae bacterium]MBT6811054.1 SH3 domain-containing protein [Anaerolineae bacterium]
MTKRKTLFILGALVALLISCSLSDGASIGAAVLSRATGTPTAARIDQPTQTPTPRPESCTVTAHALNLRAGAATSYSVLAVLDEGDRLTVLTAGDWIEVQPDKGAAGFVNSSYCKIGE